jgi:hypothetical protein
MYLSGGDIPDVADRAHAHAGLAGALVAAHLQADRAAVRGAVTLKTKTPRD